MRISNNRQGSALLLTLLIVSLLLVIVLSFVAFVRMSLRTMDQRAKNTQAQYNALAALQIAIGELQETAGPDQRTTTTADASANTDIVGDPSPTPIFPAESPRINVAAGGRYWTAVWGNAEEEIGYDLRPDEIPPTSGNQSGMTPIFLNWLVSGNEQVSHAHYANNEGGISSAAPVVHGPTSINLSDLNNPTIGGAPAALLVGPNSVGTASGSEQAYVVAPLVNMPSSSGSTGRYAWWVGDEGVKARMDLTNGYQQSQEPDDEINSFLIAQRSGVEFMDREPAGTANPTPLTEYPGDNGKVSKLLNPGQLPLIGTNTSAQDNLKEGQQSRFHDLSTYSAGVLSDAYAGGLKKDLTADIADSSSSSSGNRPADDELLYPGLSSSLDNDDPQRPTWGLIRSWARTNPPSPGTAISPVAPSATEAGVYPTIAYFSMGFNYYLDGSQVKFALYPFISLHNPYPIPIAAADYDLGLHFTDTGVFTVEVGTGVNDDKGTPETDDDELVYSYEELAEFNLYTASSHSTSVTDPPESFFRFKIKGSVIPPGERHIYILPDTEHDKTYSHVNPPVLERAPDASTIGETNYAVMEGPVLDLSTATADTTIRLTIPWNDLSFTGLQATETSLALAADEALSSSTWDPKAPGIYQAAHNIFPFVSHKPKNNFQGDAEKKLGYAFYCTDDELGETARGLTLTQRRISPQKALSAIRIATPFEARYRWSSPTQTMGVDSAYLRRPIAGGNLRAPHIMATAIENYNRMADGGGRKTVERIGTGIFGAYFPTTKFPDNSTYPPHPGPEYYRYATGGWEGPNATATGLKYTILWDLLDSPDRLLSLGQLQHVPFSKYDFQPSYLFGNSYALRRVPRDQTYNEDKLRKVDEEALATPTLPLYDESWHLNRAIWDQYFVSGVPSDLDQADLDSGHTLPNARMVHFNKDTELGDLQYSSGSNEAYENAAANLMVAGSFNINSTSEQAWRAVLGGTFGIVSNEEYAESGDAVGDLAVYPRFSHNLSRPESGIYPAQTVTMRKDATDTQHKLNTLWLGNRGLYLNPVAGDFSPNNSVEEVINELARSIVQEIRLRGPFLSLSDFINRPLSDAPDSIDSPTFADSTTPLQLAGIKGVLQAAIDNMDPATGQVNPGELATRLEKSQSGTRLNNWDDEHAVGGKSSGGDWPSQNPDEIYRTAWYMAPSYITQADLLSTLGPMLSARSDTFIIRTYGEKTAQNGNNVEARAWCEAVVQRYPEYVDDSQLPTADPAGINLSFGRRFQIVSFRWLTPSEL